MATSNGSSALTVASNHWHGECVVALLAADGINVNAEDKNGSTALHIACANRHGEGVEECADHVVKLPLGFHGPNSCRVRS